MFEIVKQVIDEWDPIGLLSIHSPKDEYDIETEKIVEQINILKPNDVADLSKIISGVFIEMFDEELFDKSYNECEIISNKILTIINKKR